MEKRGAVNNPDMAWSIRIAGLAVDEMARAGLISWDDFDRAETIVAEEIFARLCANDRPPYRQVKSRST